MNEEPMTAQAEIMVHPISRETRVPLYRGIALVTISALPAASVFSILEVRNSTLAPIVFVFASTAGLGLTMGLVSRYVLPSRGTAIRWLVALFGLSFGMIFLGWLSRGSLGLDLIQRITPTPDWQGLIRFACAAAVVWVAIRAWAGESTSVLRLEPGRIRRTRLGKMRIGGGRSMRIRSRRLRKRARLRIAAQVEHRCPYCLEIVEPRDPRGAVECSTCHAFHHADCWAVTGTCQVPHHNG
jgi:hypothetical protein